MIGQVIWLTGLSGAGKTTIARALLKKLSDKTILLDGDELRKVLGAADSGYDRESRLKLALSYARLADMLAKQNFVVVVATISLFHEVHNWNRANIRNYLEIFLDVDEDIRKQRDPKGLYAKQENGLISDMAGMETRIDFPQNPHLRLTHTVSIDDAVRLIMEKMS